jgi:hypothetical protein
MAKNDYKVLKGIDYPPNKRAEIGAIVSDLPKESISWLLASGVIESATSEKEAPIVEEVVEIKTSKDDEPKEVLDAV